MLANGVPIRFRPGRKSLRSILLGALLLLIGLPVSGQTSSSLEGTVRSADGQGLPGTQVTVESDSLTRSTMTDVNGVYRFPALPAGSYNVKASLEGFATEAVEELRLPVNSQIVFDFAMQVGQISEIVTVSAELPILDTRSSDTGAIVTPVQIATLPVNGRDYLDLMQLVPGVNLDRSKDKGSDEAAPVLGERAGNGIFLIDGMPNRDEFGGGVGSQFTQDTIQEFEVITGGFKAEFGHGSGAVINVLTKSGGNKYQGVALGFIRDDSLDEGNSLEGGNDAPKLSRENFALNLGGPVVRDKAFFFGSIERIDEDRELNFAFPAATPQVLRDFESQFNLPNITEENRAFLKFTEQVGDSHSFNQEFSYNDSSVKDFLPLSQGNSLPSTRNNLDRERFMVGLRQTSLFGSGDSPYLFEGHIQYRDHTDFNGPAHPDAGPGTAFNIFSNPFTFGVFGDLGQVAFGNAITDSNFDQTYVSIAPSMSKLFGDHEGEVGIDTLRTEVDGKELSLRNNQLFATADNFATYGPIYSGLFTLTVVGAGVPGGELVNLQNDYFGVYIQDDWQISDNFSLNVGVRYDRDSEFDDNDNIAPRIGFAWNPSPKTVVTGSAGLFYDRFRLGLVRNIPEFGGADIRLIQDLSYPQGFYNTTTIIPLLVGLCVNPAAPQAAVEGTPCPFGLPTPHYGNDLLNSFVADGRSPFPLGSVITEDTVFDLSGLTSEEYLARVQGAVPGVQWYWGPFGALTHGLLPLGEAPTTIDPSFETPYTRAYHLGIQQQVGRNQLIALDYHHKDIKNILGVRETNLEFVSRIPGFERTYSGEFSGTGIRGFGPWFEGEFDAVTASYTKRMSNRFSLSTNYTWTDATDNLVGANLGTGAFAGNGSTTSFPSDSFVGTVPVVTDPATGQSNESGSFTASNGNFIPAAGTFSNGPDLDKGPSPLAVEHQITLFGLVELPWKMQLSAIVRWNSGFRFSRQASDLSDPDGNLNYTGRDLSVEKNSFEAPDYENVDLRLAKFFDMGERFRGTILVEFFNVFNEQNAAAVELSNTVPTPFGSATQVLSGREGQIGFRLEF